MPDFDKVMERAAEVRLNFTGPLDETQSRVLAHEWCPRIFFHYKERYHPVDTIGLLTIPLLGFEQLPPGEQQEFAVSVDGLALAPPVVIDDGRMLGSGRQAFEALQHPVVGGNTVLTHGAGSARSNKFFGSTELVGPAPAFGEPWPDPSEEAPRKPRHPIKVRADIRLLYETLKHELDLHELGDVPFEGVWHGFGVIDLFFKSKSTSFVGLPGSLKVELLRKLCNSFDPANRDPVAEAAAVQALEDALPDPWFFVTAAWEVTKNCAFAEYYFVYAYNDFDDYGTWPMENYHEGDNEGCCVVFDRNRLQALPSSAVVDAVRAISPIALITSAHEDWQGCDRIDPDISDDPVVAREQLDVFIAVGSHATYPDNGTFEIITLREIVLHEGGWALVLVPIIVGLPITIAIALVVAIIDHFVDNEDETSDQGVVSVAPAQTPNGPKEVAPVMAFTKLSDIAAGGSIYSEPPERPDRNVRGFPGKLGNHDGVINHSPAWHNNTSRYFKKLLRSVQDGAMQLPTI